MLTQLWFVVLIMQLGGYKKLGLPPKEIFKKTSPMGKILFSAVPIGLVHSLNPIGTAECMHALLVHSLNPMGTASLQISQKIRKV